MASTQGTRSVQVQVPEPEEPATAVEQQPVQVQVPQAVVPLRPRLRLLPRAHANGRAVIRVRVQGLPPRILHIIAYLWNWENVHERRPRAGMPQRAVFRRIQIYASMTYYDYEKLLAMAFLLCLALIRPNILLLIVAGILSPLLGPVMTAIIGSVNGDRDYCWMGLKNTLFAIAVAAITGLVIGLTLYGIGHFFSMVALTAGDILYQCNYVSMFVRMSFAILVGAVSVLFVLSRSFLFLVRCSLNTSLLMPAVRAGVQLGLGVATQMFQPGRNMCKDLPNSYEYQYSNHLAIELMMSGLASVVQVAANLFCIAVVGTFVLRLTVCHNRIPVVQNRR